MKLNVTIESGNDAMMGRFDAAAALRDVAGKILDGFETGPILDENGNTVGSFDLELDS